jgi:hypothetical protein
VFDSLAWFKKNAVCTCWLYGNAGSNLAKTLTLLTLDFRIPDVTRARPQGFNPTFARDIAAEPPIIERLEAAQAAMPHSIVEAHLALEQ